MLSVKRAVKGLDTAQKINLQAVRKISFPVFAQALPASLLFLFFLLATPSRAVPYEPPAGPVASRLVFVTEDASVLPSGRPNPRAVTEMVDTLISALTGRKNATEAWRSLLHPKDVVGIKVSASGRMASGTRIETALAVIKGLKSAGYEKNSIIVWDRSKEDLLACGFRENDPDYTLEWTDGGSGYDPDSMQASPLLGKLMWGDSKFIPNEKLRLADLGGGGSQQFSNQSYLSKTLSKKVTRIIHIPSLQDHFLFGVNGAITGMTIHNMDNWRRFGTFSDHGESYLSALYQNENIAGKVAVTLLDALFLQYAGGPFPAPAQTLEYRTIFASYDPVAIDATARKLLDEARTAHRLPSVAPISSYIETSSLLGMGVSEEKKIRLQRVRRWEKK